MKNDKILQKLHLFSQEDLYLEKRIFISFFLI